MRRVLVLFLTASLLLLTACSTDMSVWEKDKTKPVDIASVSLDFWEVREYKAPSFSETQYRLVYPDRPVNTVLALATTALAKDAYSLDGALNNGFLKSKYELASERSESGSSETYADGLFMSYNREDAVTGRYLSSDGDYTDLELALVYDTASIENSYTSFTAVFDNITAGGVTQSDIYGVLCDIVPEDAAQALVYGADFDGLDRDGESVSPGCLFETVAAGSDSYLIGRDVLKKDGEVSVQFYIAFYEANGDESLFDEDADWDSISVFEHYDGGYDPIVKSLEDVLSGDMRDLTGSLGSTELTDNNALSGLFAHSAGKWGMTKIPGYEYSEKAVSGGTVRTLTASYQNCMENVTNALTPTTSITVTRIDKGSKTETTVSISDNAGYLEKKDGSAEALADVLKKRLRLLLGKDAEIETDMLVYSGIQSLSAHTGNIDATGFVQYVESDGYVSMPYMLVFCKKG